MPRAHLRPDLDLRPDLARNHRPEGRRAGPSSACRWRRASLSPAWFCIRPMAAGPSCSLGAAARFDSIIAAGKSAASRARRFIYRSSGRCGGSTTASNAPGSDRTARHRADSYPSSSRSDTVAAKDGARSRESGAKHRTAQGEPATNGRRQFKSHWGAQGQPGRDKARAREGFRAEPAQDVTVSDAADSDLAQARTDASVPVRESPASNPKGMDLRRMVAVEAVIIEVLFWNNASMRYIFKRRETCQSAGASTDKVPAGN